MKLGWTDGGLVLDFAFQSTWGISSLATNETTLGATFWVIFNLDGETCLTKEPGSRVEPSLGCFSITIILPDLLPICTRSESLFVFLVHTFIVETVLMPSWPIAYCQIHLHLLVASCQTP